MKKNVGMTDKIIRGTSCYCILYLSKYNYWYNSPVLGSIALILFITSVISFCPMYALFGHSSSRDKQKVNETLVMKETVNKDLILRERLALQRTILANQTTVLAFRTAMYFLLLV
jgi:putative lipase involved disintegration of autophagic bodies